MKEKTKLNYASVDVAPDQPKSVTIEKIKNGFNIRCLGMSGEETQHVKDLSQAPTILARLLGVKGSKGPSQLADMVEETDEPDEA